MLGKELDNIWLFNVDMTSIEQGTLQGKHVPSASLFQKFIRETVGKD
jgi:hypothetical protein